jgi:inosine-uridine nucleoside N-ribohydrolase
LTLIPLDVARKIVLAPSDLMELPGQDSRVYQFMRKIVPFGIGATSNLYGIEGFHLKDLLGIIALTVPGALSTRPMLVDVETRGELTRGMSVIDARPMPAGSPNVELAAGVDAKAVREYMDRILQRAG